MYADYEFYKTVYGGSEIEGGEWPEYGRKGSAFIDKITFGRLKGKSDCYDASMAACAAAEVMKKHDIVTSQLNTAVSSEGNDGYNVSYASPQVLSEQYESELMSEAELYLPRSHPLRYRGLTL